MGGAEGVQSYRLEEWKGATFEILIEINWDERAVNSQQAVAATNPPSSNHLCIQ